jgi:hypothetical protein
MLFFLFFTSFLCHASEAVGFRNAWEIGFTFGEIPVLSGSFKPGISIGYHFNEYFAVSAVYQFKDYLQRDDESFNAQNIGFDGLTGSKETTGERILVALHYRPASWSPYLMAGFVYNNADIETMEFGRQTHQIGDHRYDTEISIVQTRSDGFVPAVGFGYRYDFDNGVSLNTNIAAGIFTPMPEPEITIKTAHEIAADDIKLLKEKITTAYQENFHNRHHIFNLGVSYRFK